MKECEEAEVLKDYIEAMEKAMVFERKTTDKKYHVPKPPVISNSMELVEVKNRVKMFVNQFHECDPFPPLFMFTPDMAVSNICHLLKDLTLPKKETVCDLWMLYVNSLLT